MVSKRDVWMHGEGRADVLMDVRDSEVLIGQVPLLQNALPERSEAP